MSDTLVLASDGEGIAVAANLLATGHLVAFPTETVYGLGADATDDLAVARIFEAKGRPTFNPLIVHVAHLASAMDLADFSEQALALAKAFWPGPLTMVLPKARGARVSDLVSAGLSTIAVRVPSHPVAQAILRAAHKPIAAPSANRSGLVSPTLAHHVTEDLTGRIDAVVEGGPADVGVESTVIGFSEDGPVLLRPGGIARRAIERVLGAVLLEPLSFAHDQRSTPSLPSPGLMLSHYATQARLRLGARAVLRGEAYLAFGPETDIGIENAWAVFNLSLSGDLVEAASRLFVGLRALDASGAGCIAVAPIPKEGLGEAICDRLARAAAPRP